MRYDREYKTLAEVQADYDEPTLMLLLTKLLKLQRPEKAGLVRLHKNAKVIRRVQR